MSGLRTFNANRQQQTTATNNNLITLQQAAETVVPWLKGGAERLRQWIVVGVDGGSRKLWGVRIGGRWYTSREAIAAFLDCREYAQPDVTLEEEYAALG